MVESDNDGTEIPRTATVRAGMVKARQPLYDLNPFDSLLLILRRVGVGARVVPTLLPELPPRVSLSGMPSLCPYTTYAQSLFLLR